MNLPVCLSLASLDLLLQKIFVERCWSQICQKMGREMHPHQTRSNLDCTIFIKNYTKTYRRVMKRNRYLINNPRMFNGVIFDLAEKPYIPQKKFTSMNLLQMSCVMT